MRTPLAASLPLVAALARSASAALVEHWWNISYALANPDQLSQRRLIGVNGTWPPPPVVVNQNDTLRIHVHNGLDVPTALHSHGIYFNGSSYYDGAVSITQCGIPPGQDLTYEIPVNLQDGTFWIHGHYMGQYVDGLRTPLIIHPAAPEPYTYDEDYTIILGDWYHDQHATLIKQFLNKYNPTGAEPIPDSAILYIANGGSYAASINDIMQGNQVGDRATLQFTPGKTYRLRVINMSALAMFYFAIDGHTMRVIEADGVATQPLPAEVIPLSIAQRYSVLVTARNDTSNNWAIHANMDPDMFDQVPPTLQLNVTAQIIYSSSAPLYTPTIWDPAYPDFEELDLVPVTPKPIQPADAKHTLTATFDTFDDGTNRASFNGVTFQFPVVPSLITQLTMGNDSNDPRVYGAQTNAIILNYLDNIEVTIVNGDTGKHPFHLHGHQFQVVQKLNDSTLSVPINETQVNPLRRDTVMIPPLGSVTIRFRADNPGAWLFHCHIEWHLESGLAAVFLEAPNQLQSRMQLPQVMRDQCAYQHIATSGNVVGLNSTTDFKGEPWGPFSQDHIIGWTPKAKGALAGTILAALAGMASVVWYSMHGFNEDEMEENAKKKFAEKEARGTKVDRLKRLVNRQG
ncbi:hypothetical protein BOTBODRAFT_33956 [Botryobasidium botryosum FD-172 SS1]|uniref:Ferroxidase n=1 Tax=Botryobasidium botryosum (strain FD-172 SS1) TaxID=930990 RepID=A0A067MMH0_BOTB1|nr:hypothetical protein BOTBODRAFT_33956 [Botryobasidium botryosum FD-172 SS1]